VFHVEFWRLRDNEKIRQNIEIFMPRKIRELKTQIMPKGFVYLPKRGKGSHERWRHPLLKKTLTIPGKDGDDVPLYLEQQLEKLLIELENLREEDKD
jgi:predicted RNA binding protein YcfA (HicA-like mRNA interferase family)